jgi:hypothetical protein
MRQRIKGEFSAVSDKLLSPPVSKIPKPIDYLGFFRDVLGVFHWAG